MKQSIRLPEVQALTRDIQALIAKVQQLEERVLPGKLWYSRVELAALKGIPVSAFYNKPWLLPGEPSKQGGVDRWSYKQVWESGWIWKSDKELNPREGKKDEHGTEIGSRPQTERSKAPLRRVQRFGRSVLSGQSGPS
jgi:hypothetical protein